MEQGTRGSGKTYRQLRAVPDGGLFIVHASGMIGHCRQILAAQGRAPDAVGFMVANEAEAAPPRLLAARHIGCDHFVEQTDRLMEVLHNLSPATHVNWPGYIPEPIQGDPMFERGRSLSPAVLQPTERGSYVGDIFFGDPADSLRGTHRWDGRAWLPMGDPSETACQAVSRWFREWLDSSSPSAHWGDKVDWVSAREIARRLDGDDSPPPMQISSQEPPAIALLREAATRFREYEASHLEQAKAWRHQMHGPDSLRKSQADIDGTIAKAERNGELAGRIEAFLAYRVAATGCHPGPEVRQEI